MRVKYGMILTFVFALGAGIGAFFVTWALETQSTSAEAKPLASWLCLTPGQSKDIQEQEVEFDREMADLYDRYDLARNRLIALFSTPSTSDHVLLSQMMQVMTAHDDLQRRLVRYALAIRPRLTVDQRDKLMGLLAEYSRGIPDTSQMCERGQGQRRGRGWGRHRYRWGQMRAVYGRIPLSPEEIQTLRKVDPTFEEESTQLVGDLQRENHVLAGLFEKESAQDVQILSQLERTITAHDVLETRIGRHVLAIRSHLAPDRQRQLMNLCVESVWKTCCKTKSVESEQRDR